MLTVEITKPLYGNFVYINASILDRAIKEGVKVQVTVPNGTAVIDPAEWKATGKKMEKVFNFPDHPMILYGGNVPLPAPKGKIVEEESLEEEIKALVKEWKPVFGNELDIQIVQQNNDLAKLREAKKPNKSKIATAERHLLYALKKSMGLPIDTMTDAK